MQFKIKGKTFGWMQHDAGFKGPPSGASVPAPYPWYATALESWCWLLLSKEHWCDLVIKPDVMLECCEWHSQWGFSLQVSGLQGPNSDGKKWHENEEIMPYLHNFLDLKGPYRTLPRWGNIQILLCGPVWLTWGREQQ